MATLIDRADVGCDQCGGSAVAGQVTGIDQIAVLVEGPR
jgi:hypothetical protein